MDAAEELLPNYLRIVRGVVDADDLPLNVSREILQHNRQLDRIKAACVKRVLDLIEKLAKDEPEKFATFYKAFGNTLKEGISEDANNRERIARSEEQTSELQSLMRSSYAVFCLKKTITTAKN